MPNFSKILTAMFLITGTSVGGGMLGIPVMTGQHGFWPSLIMMIICGTMMLFTGLLYVELSIATPNQDSSERLTQYYLGGFGHRLFQGVFLFMSFASLMAYTDGGGGHVYHLFRLFTSFTLPHEVYGLLFVLLLLLTGTLHDAGIRRLNNILMMGLILTYLLLIGPGVNEISWVKLEHIDLREFWQPLPIFLTSFSCQAFVVPSLTAYLERDAKSIKTALIGGYLLSFFIYALWEMLVLGIVPISGPEGLSAAYEQGRPVTQFLQSALSVPWLSVVTEFFSFFALTTSFLGIFYGLSHFIKELLPKNTLAKRPGVVNALIIIPVIAINFYGKGIFLKAMDLTGAFGDTLLNGILPILMVWNLRYGFKKLQARHTYHLFGGIALLVIMSVFYILIAFSSFF